MIARFARWVTRSWPEPIYQLRAELGLGRGPDPIFEAKHSPYLVLSHVFALAGRAATGLAGFHQSDRLCVLRWRRGSA